MRIFALLALGVSLAGIQVVAQPVLPAQTNRTIPELNLLTVTNTVTTGSNVTYQLQHPPAGASIDASGVITWFPTEAQGPTNVTITTIAIDDSLQLATNSFAVFVTEVNSGPQLPSQSNPTVTLGTTMVITNTATDSDIPTNTLIYQLINPPTGAVIDTNGIITWTPATNAMGITNTFTTVVTDFNADATTNQSLSATNSFTVTVVSGQYQTNVLLGFSISLTAFIQNVTLLSTNFGLATVDPGRIGNGDVVKAIANEIGHGTNDPVGGKLYLVTDIADPNAPSKFIMRTTAKDYDVSQYLQIEIPATRSFSFFGNTPHQIVTTDRPNAKAGTVNDSSYTIVGFSLSTSRVNFDVQGLGFYRSTSIKNGSKIISTEPFPSTMSVGVSGSGAGQGAKGAAKIVVRGTASLSGRKVEIVPKN